MFIFATKENIFKQIKYLMKRYISTLLLLMGVMVSLAQATYFDTPVKYERKHRTSFKVFQGLDGYALASEVSDKLFGFYNGKTVMIPGNYFYEGQIIKVKKPYQIGIYKYETKNGDLKTVPIVSSKESVDAKHVKK